MQFLRNKGVTLTESLVVIAISCLLMASVTANWSGLISRSERRANLGQLVAAFNLARTSAVQRGHIVTLCPLDSNQVCSNDWNLPIAVFSDRHNLRRLMNQEDFIREFPVSGKGHFVPRPAHKRYFQFRQDGMVRGTWGNVTYCPNDNNAGDAGRLIVNRGGRVRLARDRDGDGIVEGAGGNPISCS